MGAAVIGGGALLILILALVSQAKAEKAEPGQPPGLPPMPPQPGPPVDDYAEPPPGYPPAPPAPPSDEYGEPPPGYPPSMPPPPEPLPPLPIPLPSEPPPPAIATPSGPLYLTTPFKQVPTIQWSKFVRLLAKGKEGTITKGARYGLFLFGVRRLADLGLVTNVKRGTYRGQTVWTGMWVPPYSEAIFLESSRLQYRAFIKSMMEYAKKYIVARKQYPTIFKIGTMQITMSGFLAFAHLVGFLGAINSLKSGNVKPDTLAFVKRANGLF